MSRVSPAIGMLLALMIIVGPAVAGCPPALSPPDTSLTDHFLIRYDSSNTNVAATITQLGTELETAYTTMATEFGFAAPADNQLEIKIIDMQGSGCTRLPTLGLGNDITIHLATHTMTDPDERAANAAHELFHAFQWSYAAGVLGGIDQPPWVVEGTAVWMEDAVFDHANEYVSQRSLYRFSGGTLTSSLESDSGSEEYDTVYFWKYLSERFGTDGAGTPAYQLAAEAHLTGADIKGVDFMRQLWESAGGAEGAELIESLPLIGGASMNELIVDWHVVNYVKRLGDPYAGGLLDYLEDIGPSGGADYSDIQPAWSIDPSADGAISSVLQGVQLESWSVDYFEVLLTDQTGDISVTVSGDNDGILSSDRFAAISYVGLSDADGDGLPETNETGAVSYPLAGDNYRSWTIPNVGLDRLILIVSSSSDGGSFNLDIQAPSLDPIPNTLAANPSRLSLHVDVSGSSAGNVQVANQSESGVSWTSYENINWLSASPQSGFLSSGEVVQVQVTVDPQGLLNPGTVTSYDLEFRTATETLIVPVEMVVIGDAPPELRSGGADPDPAFETDIVSFTVEYKDHEANHPPVRHLILDGQSYEMTSTGTEFGTYKQFSFTMPTTLEVGWYSYYFSFEDDAGQGVRYPTTGEKTLTVAPLDPQITITRPYTTEEQVSESFEIQWNAVNTTTVDLYYDTDFDPSQKTLIVDGTPNDGQYVWDLSEIPNGSYTVHGVAHNYDASDSDYGSGYVVVNHDLVEPRSFQPAVTVAATGSYANLGVVPGDSPVLHLVLRQADGVYHYRSEDQGRTWSPGTLVAAVTSLRGLDFAVDGVNGTLHCTWYWEPYGYYVRSDDGGSTWSTPYQFGSRVEDAVSVSAHNDRVALAWLSWTPGYGILRSQCSSNGGISWGSTSVAYDVGDDAGGDYDIAVYGSGLAGLLYTADPDPLDDYAHFKHSSNGGCSWSGERNPSDPDNKNTWFLRLNARVNRLFSMVTDDFPYLRFTDSGGSSWSTPRLVPIPYRSYHRFTAMGSRIGVIYEENGEIGYVESLDEGQNWGSINILTTTGTNDSQSIASWDDEVVVAYAEPSLGVVTQVTSTSDIPSLTLLAPNGGETLQGGTNFDILWDPPEGGLSVQIQFSADAGATWETITSSTPNTGVFAWTVPEVLSRDCLIRVIDTSNEIVADRSDGVFEVIPSIIYSVATYPLDGNVTDQSGLGNDGQAFGIDWVEDRFGDFSSAAAFIASERDTILIPDTPDLDFGTGTYAVSLWLKFSTTSENQRIFTKRMAANPYTGLMLSLIDGAITVQTGQWPEYAFLSDPSLAESDRWYHIVFQRTATQQELWVDGVMVDSYSDVDWDIDVSNSQDLVLGANRDMNDWFFDGCLDEAQVYGQALDPDYVIGLSDDRPIISQLIGHYPFNGNASDVSGLGNDGTVAGAISVWDCALRFLGGTQSVVTLPGSSHFDAMDDEFTIAFWMRATEPGVIIEKDVIGTISNDWYVAVDSQELFIWAQNTRIGTSVPVLDDIWRHYAIVRDRSLGEIQIYIDGVLVNTGTGLTGSLGNSAEINVGAWDTPSGISSGFVGALDELRIFGSLVQVADIASWVEEVPCGGALIGRYPFDGDADDLSTYDNDGVLNGALSSGDCYLQFLGGGASVVNLGRTAELDNLGDEFTIAFWMRATEPGVIIEKDVIGTISNDWYVAVDSQELFIWAQNTRIGTSVPVLDDIWRHYAIVRDRSLGEIQIYIDGVLVHTGTGLTGSLSNSAEINVGAWDTPSGVSSGFTGHLDDLHLFNVALSSSAIAAAPEQSCDATSAPVTPRSYATSIHMAQPNPFNPRTTLVFEIAEDGPVTVELFSIAGRRVRTLLRGDFLVAGEHRVRWDGTDESGRRVASGVYIVRLDSRTGRDTARMTLLK